MEQLVTVSAGGEEMEKTKKNKYSLGSVVSRERNTQTMRGTIKEEDDEENAVIEYSKSDNKNKVENVLIRQVYNAVSDRRKESHAHEVLERLKKVSSSSPRLLPVQDYYTEQSENEENCSRDLFIVYEDVSCRSLALVTGENSFEPDVTAGMPALESSDLMKCFFHVLEGLKSLHENGIPHMDLHPENILFAKDPRGVLLTNYGLSDLLSTESFEFCGPEIHKRDMLSLQMEFKADVWAFGAVMLYACTGMLIVSKVNKTWQSDLESLLEAFEHRNDSAFDFSPWNIESLIEKHVKEYPQAKDLWTRIPSDMAIIIDKCLTIDPIKRPSIAEICAFPEYLAMNVSYRNSEATTQKDNESKPLGNNVKELHKEIYSLRKELKEAKEHIVVLQTILAEEQAGHVRTATLLDEERKKLSSESNQTPGIVNTEEVSEIKEAIPAVFGAHHPGFYNGELDEWNCCNKRGRLPPGCQEGIIMHHPGYYDPYGGGIWGCCEGGWNAPGCTPGEQPRWER